jgi:hypothetical protein
MVSYKNDSIIPQGMSLVEGRFLLGYQFKYEKTKQLTHEQLQNRANHKVSLSNPLSAMAKVRMRYEIQRHNTGLLVAGSVNYFAIDNSGLDSTQHKTKVGWQVYLEGRQYLDERRSSFIYGKLGKGQSTMYDYSMNHHGYYTYSLVGGGYGRCIKMSPRFFFEFNVGAKYCFGNNEFTRDYRESASLVGAMSIIDLNMHLGLYLSQINTSVEEDYHSGEHVHLSRRWKKVLKVIFLPWLW